MRKLSVILLISLFAFSQYARQLSYFECKISNIFKNGPAKCDCEKTPGFDKPDDNQSPISATHSHVHLDEFFSTVREFDIDLYSRLLKPNSNRLPGFDELKGFYPGPWQPPNA